jgi:alkyl hydroperoxide reductase subunit AhpC
MKVFARVLALSLGLILPCVVGCENKETDRPAATPGGQAQAVSAASVEKQSEPSAVGELEMALAVIGKPAPDFALKDVTGKEVKLSEFKGKTVILEWFNPECPYVKLSHTKGSLKGMAKRYQQEGDVVWLAINSGGEGRQGYGADKNQRAARSFGMEHPLLLDTTGRVGKAYGATNTPHMFVIDKQGTLKYQGAIDNSPDGEGQAPQGDGALLNYVEQALDELAADKAISVPETKAYGCSVKYANG